MRQVELRGRSVFPKPKIVAVRRRLLFCWCHPWQSCSDLQFLDKKTKTCFCFFKPLSFVLSVAIGTKMGLLLRGILLLSACTFTAGVDFQLGFKPFGQSGFVRRSNTEGKAAKIVKRSLPAWLAPSPNHKIKRRSTEEDDSCKALQGYVTKLDANTHDVSYPLRSCYTSHVWQREDDTQVLSKCRD